MTQSEKISIHQTTFDFDLSEASYVGPARHISNGWNFQLPNGLGVVLQLMRNRVPYLAVIRLPVIRINDYDRAAKHPRGSIDFDNIILRASMPDGFEPSPDDAVAATEIMGEILKIMTPQPIRTVRGTPEELNRVLTALSDLVGTRIEAYSAIDENRNPELLMSTDADRQMLVDLTLSILKYFHPISYGRERLENGLINTRSPVLVFCRTPEEPSGHDRLEAMSLLSTFLKTRAGNLKLGTRALKNRLLLLGIEP